MLFGLRNRVGDVQVNRPTTTTEQTIRTYVPTLRSVETPQRSTVVFSGTKERIRPVPKEEILTTDRIIIWALLVLQLVPPRTNGGVFTVPGTGQLWRGKGRFILIQKKHTLMDRFPMVPGEAKAKLTKLFEHDGFQSELVFNGEFCATEQNNVITAVAAKGKLRRDKLMKSFD